jgi:hypothetical protein
MPEVNCRNILCPDNLPHSSGNGRTCGLRILSVTEMGLCEHWGAYHMSKLLANQESSPKGHFCTHKPSVYCQEAEGCEACEIAQQATTYKNQSDWNALDRAADNRSRHG